MTEFIHENPELFRTPRNPEPIVPSESSVEPDNTPENETDSQPVILEEETDIPEPTQTPEVPPQNPPRRQNTMDTEHPEPGTITISTRDLMDFIASRNSGSKSIDFATSDKF
jgi:hypothetical protein